MSDRATVTGIANCEFPKRLAVCDGWLHFAGVHLAHLRLRDFRNYARLDADFASGFRDYNARGKISAVPVRLTRGSASKVSKDFSRQLRRVRGKPRDTSASPSRPDQ